MKRPLKERLASRYEAQVWDEYGPAVDSRLVNPDGPEALARIEALEAALRVARRYVADVPIIGDADLAVIDQALGETQ